MEFCMVIIGSVALAAGMDAAKIELKKVVSSMSDKKNTK
jgi:hypothetical protein